MSTSCYHSWQKQEDLDDKSSAPHRKPKATPPDILEKALSTTLFYNTWGGVKLSTFLLNNGFCYLSPATLNRIKKRLTGHLKKKELKLAVSYEFINPNDAWSIDFLEFKWGNHKLYILTILDDCSRYLLNWTVTTEATTAKVQELLKDTFVLFGLPKNLKSDNGPQFREDLVSFLEKFKIEHFPSPPMRPTYNGKTERHNEEVRFAVNRAVMTDTVEDLINVLGRSFYEYNYIRPHQALDGATPYMRYSGLEEEIKARIEVFKEQEVQRKKHSSKRAIMLSGDPDPDYVPQALILPGQHKKISQGLIVPVKSKNIQGETIGYVRQSLHS